MIHYRLVAETLATMRADAIEEAAAFYGVDQADPRLLVDFLGAMPAQLTVGPNDMPDYPDGINILSALGWVGRFDADLLDQPPAPALLGHAAHPSINRMRRLDDGEGPTVGETATGRLTPTLTWCGLTAADMAGGTVYQLPAGFGPADYGLVTCRSCQTEPSAPLAD